MKRWTRLGNRPRITCLALVLLVIGMTGSSIRSNIASASLLPAQSGFTLAAPQGFGDRQNSWTWSMKWWKGHLYVGTNRAWHCAEVASFHLIFPEDVPYPPLDPDIECTPDPEDLPLQAEIWRWTPGTNTWERVYQSPNDVFLPSGKPIGRDAGYRGMAIFEEADGAEALYVTSVSSRFVYPTASDLPPPRILRSTDGLNFAPVPQEPGTVLGDFVFSSLRSPVSYKGRLYVVGGMVQGSGVLLESADPASGDFRKVNPAGLQLIVSSVQTFNGYLYVGTHDLIEGYRVYKTDATGEPPYTYIPVVGPGGHLPGVERNTEVLNMVVYNGRLYVGCNGLKSGLGGTGIASGAELIRVNPDDTWDLLVGNPRTTPDGPKFPLSGYIAGFGSVFNAHLWRLEVYDGSLYVGTFDSSTTFKDDPDVGPLVVDQMGFDLYVTSNGVDFVPITTTGFGDMFNFGVRALRATPYGLFLGTANYYYGLQVWRASDPLLSHRVYLPLVLSNSVGGTSSSTPAVSLHAALPSGLQPPRRVEAEVTGETVLVSWEPTTGASQYHIFRSEIKSISGPLVSKEANTAENPATTGHAMPTRWEGEITLRPIEVGTTTEFYFVDDTAEPRTRYTYHIESSDGMGKRSGRSNLAAAFVLGPPVTFGSLSADLAVMNAKGHLSLEGETRVGQALATAQAQSQQADLTGAALTLADLRNSLEQEAQSLVTHWKAEELVWRLRKLERRVQLVQLGLLCISDLD